ncbi:elastin-like [Arapaima gigas]
MLSAGSGATSAVTPGVTPAQLPFGGQPVVPAGLGSNGDAGTYTAGQLPYVGQPTQSVGTGDQAVGRADGMGYSSEKTTSCGLGAGLGVDAAAGKYGGAAHLPYNGAGLDGTSQMPFDPQQAGLGAEGKPAVIYGYDGLPNLPPPLALGAAGKSAGKYGIGGFLYGAQPLGFGVDGKSGKYGNGGYVGAQPLRSDGKSAEKYGQGGSPYGMQPLGLGADGKPASPYGNGGLPYYPKPLALGADGKSGKYANNGGLYDAQPLGLGSEVKSAGTKGNGALTAQPLGLETDGGKESKYGVNMFFGNGYQGEEEQTLRRAAKLQLNVSHAPIGNAVPPPGGGWRRMEDDGGCGAELSPPSALSREVRREAGEDEKTRRDARFLPTVSDWKRVVDI